MTSINQLPNELFSHIFKHLDLKDLSNCRLVSQGWKILAEDVKITQLVYSPLFFGSFHHLSSRRPWYLTVEEINPGNIIQLHPIHKLIHCPFDLSHVKRLRLDGMNISRMREVEDFNFNEFVGNFPRLSHLEMVLFGSHRPNTRIHLDLPATLRTISLVDVHRVVLYLNAPQLENVSCDFNIQNIKFSNPASVKHLRISNSGPIGYHLQIFSNVEYLHCGRQCRVRYDKKLFELYPQLKEIHFEVGAKSSVSNSQNSNKIPQRIALYRNGYSIFHDGTKKEDFRSVTEGFTSVIDTTDKK